MGIISLEDLKRREYSESFDELLAQAKEFATNRDDELDILRNWILYALSCRKSTGEGNSLTDIDPKEKPENRGYRYKIVMKKMEGKNSPYAYCSGSSADQDECLNKRIAASSSSARRKRKSQANEEQHAHNYAAEAGDLMNLVETENKVKRQRVLPFDGPPPELPMDFRNKIASLHGSEAKLVIQKEITVTDVSKKHDRLNMPRNQVLTMDVLNEQEQKIVSEHGLAVRVIQPCLEEEILFLKKWNSHSGYSYVLRTGWKDVFNQPENNIRPGNLQVWSFRVDDRGEVWFALVCYERD